MEAGLRLQPFDVREDSEHLFTQGPRERAGDGVQMLRQPSRGLLSGEPFAVDREGAEASGAEGFGWDDADEARGADFGELEQLRERIHRRRELGVDVGAEDDETGATHVLPSLAASVPDQ